MEVADITIIGSGIAATLTLIEVFNQLLQAAPAERTLSITVIEKNQEFWKGVPYGSRSSVNALTITSIHDFIYEQERPVFFEWLKANQNEWAAYYRETGGITAARWLKTNLPLIENEEWENVYVPRFLFGNYVKEKLTNLRRIVEEKQLAKVALVRAEAVDVTAMGDGNYEIIAEHPDTTLSTIVSRKLVVASGSSPVKKMCDMNNSKAVYFNDIYEPSVNDNIDTLQATLGKTVKAEDRNVLIIGSNASSLELIYLLEGMTEIRRLINKIVVISSSGMFPYPISMEELDEHPIPHIDKVKTEGNYNIKTLADAAGQDIKLAMHDGANMAYVATIIGNTLKLMEPLGEDARKEFFGIHAIKLRDSFRRAGPEYRNVAQSMLDIQEVIMLRGKFLNTVASDDGVLIKYLDMETDREQTYLLNIKAIINCSGSENLDQSSSRLLYNLVNNRICNMNLSGKGIEVNEHFEAAPNLYVMGPLLGGNVNKLIHFWQLENASRLTYLAPYLAKELLNG